MNPRSWKRLVLVAGHPRGERLVATLDLLGTGVVAIVREHPGPIVEAAVEKPAMHGHPGVAARRPVFRPIHRALELSGYPEAERLWARALSLPCYPSLSDAEVDTVAAALTAALEE